MCFSFHSFGILMVSTPSWDCAGMVSPQGGVREPGREDLNIVHSSQDRLRRRAQCSRVTSALNRTQKPFQISQCAADIYFLKPLSPTYRAGDIQCAKDTSRFITDLHGEVITAQCELEYSASCLKMFFLLELTLSMTKKDVCRN